MAELLELVRSALGPEAIGALGRRLNLSPDAAERAVALSLPTVMGAMAHQATTPAGAAELNDELAASQARLDDLPGQIESGEAERRGAAPLGRLLGESDDDVLAGVGSRVDVGRAAAAGVLATVTTAILGGLHQLGGDAGALTREAAGASAAEAPGGPATIARILAPLGVTAAAGGVTAAAAAQPPPSPPPEPAEPAQPAEPRRATPVALVALGAAALAAGIGVLVANRGASSPPASAARPVTRTAPQPATRPSSAAEAAARRATVAAVNKIALQGITFVTAQATITPAGRATLDRVARILKGNPTIRLEVQGHTDGEGKAAKNLALSRARAAAVVAALTSRGVAAGRLVARGYGETRPVASNASAAGRARNRRVQFQALR